MIKTDTKKLDRYTKAFNVASFNLYKASLGLTGQPKQDLYENGPVHVLFTAAINFMHCWYMKAAGRTLCIAHCNSCQRLLGFVVLKAKVTCPKCNADTDRQNVKSHRIESN